MMITILDDLYFFVKIKSLIRSLTRKRFHNTFLCSFLISLNKKFHNIINFENSADTPLETNYFTKFKYSILTKIGR